MSDISNKYIVTTTISPPSEALLKFAGMVDWQLIVVGDLKTPHKEYSKINCLYLSPEEQKNKYPELSNAIGWNTIQRRNIGFVEAYKMGAEVVATVDDDNIPYPDWGEELFIGQEIEADLYEPKKSIFDPLSATESSHLWHRGFPIQYLPFKNEIINLGKINRKVLIQADLWDGDPDIDAIARLMYPSQVEFSAIKGPFCATTLSPFNSQNTFLAREVIPYYAVYPYVGRMDDIWGGYFLQCLFPDSLVYNRATVFQERNPQDIITNLENEIIGHRKTLELINSWGNKLQFEEELPFGVPDKTLNFYKIYREQFTHENIWKA